ncbi:hypothetical protein LEP1GSC008_1482 [Leptospira kirschneri serovar Bulgarica str. Nikolaevo]|uniref:Uncharacterized protein n=1 Tax=Leptospira kirschneri serovar Bulgarica str. Nikolaevo TaxID=1240687 RepID=M6FRE7_9LEPT|nr:hypothetical protein LEP1GSC008_1482 [Leptospira kirschneri serovar Bulgarica str. Nikolaevo]
MERKELSKTLFTKALTQCLASTVARQVVSQSTMKFASCDDDP